MVVPRLGYGFSCLFLASCASEVHPRAPAPPSAPAHALIPPIASDGTPSVPSASETTAAPSAPAAAPSAPTAAPSATAAPRACGSVGCLAFATPEAAFAYVLLERPRVLALGEAHAQQGTAGVRSSTRRFAEQLLPQMAGKSKHLVIELLVANCKPKVVAGVARTQAPVTEQQAGSNQNEFLTLGKYAQHLGIEPEALTPSCEDYDAVVAAGEAGVDRLLTLITDQTRKSVAALLTEPEAVSGTVLTYGGALHNDLYPRAGHERWSFGPELARLTEGRYVELDLIVPEFVKDSEAWRHLPWFSAFDREQLPSEALLYRPAPHSFALIFPKTNTRAVQGL